jgi:AAA+ ATPase superfamily predicted ATPase
VFFGRENELATLNKQYNNNTFSFVPIYGRRRVGKTQLIEEFIRNKKAIFFTAVNKATYKNNLELLSKAIFENNENVPIYSSFSDALDGIYALAQKEKLIFVIDEFPYFAQSNESIISILQQYIDLKFLKTNMMLILSGSSLSFMENQVMGYQSPLYGRRSGQIRLLPMNFQTAREFVPNLSKYNQAVVYGVTGAIPKYLSLFNDSLSLTENIKGQYFDRNAYLFEETTNLLKQEFMEPALYQSIITAIATGASQMKDIQNKVGEESSTVATYIKSLLETGIIKKEIPAMDKEGSRKTIYRLQDGMFRFWYRFIYPNVSLISLDKGEIVYNRIESQINDFMGEVFEKLCIEYMWYTYDKLPFKFQNISRWWGNNPDLKSQIEIDFIAYNNENEQAIFGECKWRNEKIDKKTVEQLIEKTKMFYRFEEKHYYLFSRSGFTSSAIKYAAKQANIQLIEFNDMF